MLHNKQKTFKINLHQVVYLGGIQMDFYELIEMARSRECSDVHITVGTAIALRRLGFWKFYQIFHLQRIQEI